MQQDLTRRAVAWMRRPGAAMDLDAVAAFVVLAQERHYGRAAARLHVSTSTLTRRIQRLEAQVGAVLVERDTTGVAGPTAAGFRVLDHAPALLEQARVMARAAHEADVPVRLGVPGSIGDFPNRADLTRIGALVRRDRPERRVRVSGVPMSQLVPSLLSGQVDVLWSVGAAPNPDLVSVPLTDVDRVGIIGPTHALAGATEVDVEEFVRHPMIHDPTVNAEWMSWWYLADVRPARHAQLVAVNARDVTAVLGAVVQGHAATVLHAPLGSGLPFGMQSVALPGAPKVRYVAMYRRGDHRQGVRELVGAMRDVALSL